jgi:NAD-dependent DNA ligase
MKLVDKFKKHGPQVLSFSEIKELVEYANKMYYNEEPILTDNEFDILCDLLPENEKTIGSPIISKNKAVLPYFMPSMNKIKPDTNALYMWMHKYSNYYIVSSKLDGVSGLLCYSNKINKLYTRGDGEIGQDISYLIPHLKLPKDQDKEIVVRGEFVIPKEIFNLKYKHKYANARNLVAGIINRNTVDLEKISDVHFVAYEVIEPSNLFPSNQFNLLKKSGFNTVNNFRITETNLTNHFLSESLIKIRENDEYDTDGIIITHDELYPRNKNNPDHSFAFKMVLQEQMAEAKVIDVIWSASKDGYLKPRVQIEPIILGGVKIEFATGFNAAFIEKNKIGLGALIQIIRSGDVIPHIQKVIKPCSSGPKMPDESFGEYDWTSTHVDIVLKDLESNNEIREKLVTQFFKKIKVDGLGQGNVARIIDAGFDTIPKIVAMKKSDYLLVEGFKEKMAQKISESIQIQLAEASLVTIAAASNIFGRGYSETKISALFSSANFLSFPKMNEFKHFLKDIGQENKLNKKDEKETKDKEIKENIKQESNIFFDKKIVLTGKREKIVIDFLEKSGAKIGAAVTKKTDLVIASNLEENSTKISDAKELKIPILSCEEFIAKYISGY